MILSDIKTYLMQHGHASEKQMARAFKLEPSALQGMLDHWQRKGSISCYRPTDACGVSCHACPMSKQTLYQWNQN